MTDGSRFVEGSTPGTSESLIDCATNYWLNVAGVPESITEPGVTHTGHEDKEGKFKLYCNVV